MQNPEIMLRNRNLKTHPNTSLETILLQEMTANDTLSEPLLEHDIHALAPATNIEEYENKFIISMVIPGLEKKDIAIHVKNNQITVRVEKKGNVRHQKLRTLLQEFNFFNLYRTFLLPNDLQLENITADYAEGILQIILPKFESGTHFPAQTIPVR